MIFGRWRRKVLPPVSGFRFGNQGKRQLSLYFEPMPERYVLRPGETLEIQAAVEIEACDLFLDEGEEALTFWVHGWLGLDEVTIDGRPAISWPDEGKSSSDQHPARQPR